MIFPVLRTLKFSGMPALKPASTSGYLGLMYDTVQTDPDLVVTIRMTFKLATLIAKRYLCISLSYLPLCHMVYFYKNQHLKE